MAGKKTDAKPRKRRPAATPEAREKQLVSLAVDLAEKQLREGTASNQVIIHYLKLGTERERLEREMLEKKTQLVGAQAQAVQSAQRVESLYSDALAAMKRYSGQADHDEDSEIQ